MKHAQGQQEGIRQETGGPSHPARICYILKKYPTISETFLVNEMAELQRQGIPIIIVAKKDSGLTVVHEKVKALQAPICYLPSSSDLGATAWSARAVATYGAEPTTLDKDSLRGELTADEHATMIQAGLISPYLKTLGIQHIHAHFASWAATAASYVSRMTGIPYSFTAHAKDIYHQKVNPRGLAEKIAGAKFVITVSDYNKRFLDDLLHNQRMSGTVIRLYNGIDLDQFHAEPSEKEPNLIVSIGRLVPKKGFQYLLDACKILKEQGIPFHCAIIGEGDERHNLEARIRQYSLDKDITLLGAKTQAEVKRLIQRATVFVLPCIVDDNGDRDGLPTVLLEAMALGTPVISTRVTGIPEIIEHGKTGCLVEEKEPRELAQTIQELLGSESRRTKLSEAALVKVRQDFDVTANVSRLKEYFLTS
jgi:colanic acid/amylovoran biosynthesis glycosyltransferase